MTNNSSKEITAVISDDSAVEFEQIAGENTSPLNAPVIEKDIAGAPQPGTLQSDSNSEDQEKESPASEQEDLPDAPEQQIDDDYDNPESYDSEEAMSDVGLEKEVFELPTAHAKQAADTFLGMADNFLEIGGGFFVKVKKHNDFYDFEEIVQVIDEHNAKNVKRLRLEKEDKALLKPLLVEVLKKKAAKLTPEQQLMGALISILVKKAQIVMEVRAENEILVDRILNIIREEKSMVAEGLSEEDHEQEDDELSEDDIYLEQEHDEDTEEGELEYEEVHEPSPVIAPEAVMEVATTEVEQQDKGDKK
ncbi:MAG: hypothetical protein R8G66_06225 [Cytophagales bacterium]|nr:hypothetical protein [Cytophagales bacterium]